MSKTCLVVRHGAIGDHLQTTSVIKGLYDQGYSVDVLCQTPQHVVYENNPYIRELIVVDRDQIKNEQLPEFWAHWESKYSKAVNLSECVERTLLVQDMNRIHFWKPDARELITNHCYQTVMHRMAGVPDKSQCKFFPSKEEEQIVNETVNKKDINIMWVTHGSAVHKVWGGTKAQNAVKEDVCALDVIFARILVSYPNAKIWCVGDEKGNMLIDNWSNEPRIINCCGTLSIRHTLALSLSMDIAIGPETGFMNGVANERMEKILFLSHSTKENYSNWTNTSYLWSKNTVCPGRGNNEAKACHQLHYGPKHCKIVDSGVAQCQEDISVADVWTTIEKAINKIKARK